MKYQIFDSSNSNKISEGEIPDFSLDYEKFKPDDKTLIEYDFTRDYEKSGAKKLEPIKL
jgi:hypothetical protein